ncbi:MAG: aspartate-semialdehyde dehydrogenase, partial [Bacteroidia bacterium]
DGYKIYPHEIDLNVLPQVDIFLNDGYTKEEHKLIQETQKILECPELAITATAVRVPVMGGHSESVNVQFKSSISEVELRTIISNTTGCVVFDDPQQNQYPMPITAHENDTVWVGRIRKDPSALHAFNLWIVSDNLRKGAATNAVQIAEYLIQKQFLISN